jgi:hypothetical protein
VSGTVWGFRTGQGFEVCVDVGGGPGGPGNGGSGGNGGAGGGASGVSLGTTTSQVAPLVVASGGGGGGGAMVNFGTLELGINGAAGGGGGAAADGAGGGGGGASAVSGGAGGIETGSLGTGSAFDTSQAGGGLHLSGGAGSNGAQLNWAGGGGGGGGYFGGGGGGVFGPRNIGRGGGGGGGGSDFCGRASPLSVSLGLVTFGCSVSSGAGTETAAGSAAGDAQVTLTASSLPIPFDLPTEITGAGTPSVLYGVSCNNRVNCTAVGQDGNGQPIYASVGTGQSRQSTELPAAGGGGLFSVSCSDSGDCTAVGSDGSGQPIVATESSGNWGSPMEVPGSSGGGILTGVSCLDTLDCTAVGHDGSGQPFYASESGGTWGAATELSGSPGGGGLLNGVSCPDATDCTAVGQDGSGQPIYVTEAGGIWGPPTEISGPNGGGLYSVSCLDVGDCTAVGSDGNALPVYATESGGTWGAATELSGSLGGSGLLYGVSCADAADCTAVGSDGAGQPISVIDASGVWGAPTEIPGSPGGGGLLNGVSCTLSTECTAVGQDHNGLGISTTTGPLSQVGQTISFTSMPPSTPTVGGTYSPTATAISNLPVALTIDASSNSICSISNAGVVAFNGAGTCLIDADQPGDPTYYTAAPTLAQSVSVAPALAMVTTSDSNAVSTTVDGTVTASVGGTTGATLTVTDYGTNPEGTLSLNSSAPEYLDVLIAGADQSTAVTVIVCGVPSGPVSWLSPGGFQAVSASAISSATQVQCPNSPGSLVLTLNANTSPNPQQLTGTEFVVVPGQVITFMAPKTGWAGGQATLAATGGGSDNPVVFSIDHTSGAGVCTVSGTNGTTVKYGAAGSCVIDANQVGTPNQYKAATQLTRTIAVVVASNASCTGLLPPGIYRNVTVTATCTVTGSDQIVGNLQVQRGGALQDTGASIGGDLQANNAQWIVVGGGGTVAGNLQITGLTGRPLSTSANDLCRTTVGGNVQVQNNDPGAPFDIGGAPDCTVGLSVAGNLTVQNNAASVTVGSSSVSNTVTGNIQVHNNTGGGSMSGNVAHGACTLHNDNPPIVGSGNTPSTCNLTG